MDINLEKERIYSDFNSKIQKKYSEISLTIDDAINNQLQKRKSEIDEKINKQLEKRQLEIDAEIEGFADLKVKLQEQLNLFSSDVLSNKNIEQAEKEKVTADSLRKMGIIWLSVLATLSMSYFIYLVFIDTATDFKALLFRWLVLLFLSLPSIEVVK